MSWFLPVYAASSSLKRGFSVVINSFYRYFTVTRDLPRLLTDRPEDIDCENSEIPPAKVDASECGGQS
jgi:hypothetical protein